MKNQRKRIKAFYLAFAIFACLAFAMLSGCSSGDDNDENTVADPVVKTTWYRDSDGDGYGNPAVSVEEASQPSGYVSGNTDCNDTDPAVHPGATETCGDGIDQNCDGPDLACEPSQETWYKDSDGDGYSDGTTQTAVSQPAGWFLLPNLTAGSGDCDDTDPTVNPGAAEACADGLDNDCNGQTDCDDGNCASAAVCDDSGETGELTYPVVDTMQTNCYDLSGNEIVCGSAYPGQDAEHTGNQASYTDNGDDTVTDNVTGLMWTREYLKTGFDDAQGTAEIASVGGYDDWRVPTTKELYSLVDFSGVQGTADPSASDPPPNAVPFIDTNHFDFDYGADGDRYIDAQYVAATKYVATVMNGQEAFFGVNFADGRIKGYPSDNSSGEDRYFFRMVRGNSLYGQNEFTDNGDGTISDKATDLTWMRVDSGDSQFAGLVSGFTYDDGSMNWEEALEFVENVEYAGHDDWRLPNAKELHTIVDYTRSPDTTGSAAIDPMFDASRIINEAGEEDYPFYWTSTSFKGTGDAVIIQFGRSLGYMNDRFSDVHGAGGQRTDPKTGEPSYGLGPQGDVRRVYNHVRLVRGGLSE